METADVPIDVDVDAFMKWVLDNKEVAVSTAVLYAQFIRAAAKDRVPINDDDALEKHVRQYAISSWAMRRAAWRKLREYICKDDGTAAKPMRVWLLSKYIDEYALDEMLDSFGAWLDARDPSKKLRYRYIGKVRAVIKEAGLNVSSMADILMAIERLGLIEDDVLSDGWDLLVEWSEETDEQFVQSVYPLRVIWQDGKARLDIQPRRTAPHQHAEYEARMRASAKQAAAEKPPRRKSRFSPLFDAGPWERELDDGYAPTAEELRRMGDPRYAERVPESERADAVAELEETRCNEANVVGGDVPPWLAYRKASTLPSPFSPPSVWPPASSSSDASAQDSMPDPPTPS